MTDEPTRRQQHLVSNGYQKNFADGMRVSVIDAATGQVIDARRSTRENWRVQDFLSVITPDGTIDDKLEKEFAHDERVILNDVRHISTSRGATPEQRKSLDRLAAIHLIRSLAFRDEHDTVIERWLPDGVVELASRTELPELFKRSRGRLPEPGELDDLVAEQAAKLVASPDLLPHSIKRGAVTIHGLLAKWHVQLICVSEQLPGFVLADNPVLHGHRKTGQFGFRDAGAVGDADTIIVPIGRHLAASYSATQLPTVRIQTKQGLNWLNSLLLRGASQEVICHPDDALHTTRLIRNLDDYPAAKFDRATIR